MYRHRSSSEAQDMIGLEPPADRRAGWATSAAGRTAHPGQPSQHELPVRPVLAAEVAVEELKFVYAFIYARVGNRPDAEDLTQQVALKAIPRLKEGAGSPAVRAYLFATARSVLGAFWSARFGMHEDELRDDLWADRTQPEARTEPVDRVRRILDRLPSNHRRVLDLRFLKGYSLKEVAAEMGSTVGGIKVMQLRALRAAAKIGLDA
jgi:RNA polymerase sigma-70 factor (ECF subfamily)